MPQLSFAEAVRDALRDEMRRDPDVILLGGYVRAGTQGGGMTSGLGDEFGTERVLDTPIAEAALAGIAAGAAAAGLRPVVRIGNLGYALSLLDQICNQAAKAHFTFDGQVQVPVVYWFEASLRGWGVHHSQAIYAVLCQMPGLKVVMPSTPRDAAGLLKSAIRDNNPVAYIVHPELFLQNEEIPANDDPVGMGTARVAREGADVSVVTCGSFVGRAMDAALSLEAEGISLEVVDLRSLVPLDWATITRSVAKTRRAVVYDQGHRSCGVAVTVASGIQERLFHGLKAPVGVLTTADSPVAYNLRLEDQVIPTTRKLIDRVRRCLSE